MLLYLYTLLIQSNNPKYYWDMGREKEISEVFKLIVFQLWRRKMYLDNMVPVSTPEMYNFAFKN